MPKGYSNKTGRSVGAYANLTPNRRPELHSYASVNRMGKEYDAVDAYTTLDQEEVRDLIDDVTKYRY